MALPNCLRSFDVPNRVIERALREADHLRADADASLVERLDRDLVALAWIAEHVGARHLAVLEDQLAGAAGANPELVFLLADREAGGPALDDERGDAAVAGVGIDRREDDEDVRFVAVGDPELAAGDRESVAALGGARRQRERVAAGPGFRQGIRADALLREAGEARLLLRVATPAKQRVDDERVLHVNQHADRGIDTRERFDGEHRVKEGAAGAAVSIRGSRCP